MLVSVTASFVTTSTRSCLLVEKGINTILGPSNICGDFPYLFCLSYPDGAPVLLHSTTLLAAVSPELGDGRRGGYLRSVRGVHGPVRPRTTAGGGRRPLDENRRQGQSLKFHFAKTPVTLVVEVFLGGERGGAAETTSSLL